jgi:uncharacterized membrane protein
MDDAGSQPPATAKAMTLYRPALVALLYLLNIFLGFSVFVGIVLAYVWRSDAETQEWEKTHFTYLIRTFWIGFAGMFGGFCLMIASFVAMAVSQEINGGNEPALGFFAFFPLLMLFYIALMIWFCVRSVISLVKAGDCKPISNPETWLF